MTRRVYEIARELGLPGKNLADKINLMGLGFVVNNHMSTLNEDQVGLVKRALDQEARKDMVEERISSTVIRRKRKRRKVVATSVVAEEPAVQVAAPVVAPPAADTVPPPAGTPEPEVVAAEAPAPESPPEAPAATPITVAKVAGIPDSVRKMAEAAVRAAKTAQLAREQAPAVSPEPVVAPQEAEPPAVAAEAAPEATPSEPEAAPEPTRVEPETEEPAQVQAPAQEQPVAVAPGEPTVPQEEPKDMSVPAQVIMPGRGTAAIVAALAKQQAAQSARHRHASSAQVVGVMSPELLQQRLAVDNKTFGLPPKPAAQKTPSGTRETFEQEQARGRKRRRGKKVYGANELYDRRSNRRRAQKKSGGGTTQITQAAEHKRVIKMESAILVSELAHQMGVKSGEIALKMMLDLGIKGANINTVIDYDVATLVAEGYGYSVEQVGFELEKFLPPFADKEEDYVRRPPVVTVMGHVDHGKTSLLDVIRETSVASGEHGGITQHIGAYTAKVKGQDIVFLDTPGHEAFTALRARGAQATDIVILVVAADDGVMPQTVEAINHAKDAGVPIVVAINKIDKQGANSDRVMQALSEYNLIPEAWGGDTLFQPISAKEETGIAELLESVILQAEVLELKGNPVAPVRGTVIESRLDIGRGPVATVLVQAGTFKAGQVVVVGAHWGRIRVLMDYRGVRMEEAGPSIPVEITGLDGVPGAGKVLYGVDDEKTARTIAQHVSHQDRQKELAKRNTAAPTDLQDLARLLDAGKIKDLRLIVKADVQGSQEALQQALEKLSTDEVAVKIVHTAVGGITESDINLAASAAEGAFIIGFNVRPETRATSLAEQLGIRILTFNVVYDVVDSIRKIMTGMLEPVFEERYLGRAEVRDVFGIPKVGTVAGCMVIDGLIQRGSLARILRNSRIIYESNISSLRRFKDDVKEVKNGFECGLSVHNYNDIKLGDIIETYQMDEIAPTL